MDGDGCFSMIKSFRYCSYLKLTKEMNESSFVWVSTETSYQILKDILSNKFRVYATGKPPCER